MDRIFISTIAYNAEKTLPRAIESILGQTHDDFVYYICDNASTDKTGEIIRHYASQDDRIIPLSNEINGEGINTLEIIRLCCQNNSDNSYFCTLDADDEYRLDYFEKMSRFIEENNLNIAACGNDMIDASTAKLIQVRQLNKNLILSGQDFTSQFPLYYQFMRTVWGKMYSLSVLGKCAFDKVKSVCYGADTIIAMEAFKHAERGGILAQSLHKYYLSSKSISYHFDNKRIVSDKILFDVGYDYLIAKGRKISAQNEGILYQIYFYAIKDTLNVVLKAQISPFEKIGAIHEVFTCQYTRELIRRGIAANELNKVCSEVSKWILAQKECRHKDNLDIAVQILTAMFEDMSQVVSQDSLKYIVSKIPEIVEYLQQKEYSLILERLNKWFKKHDEDVLPLTELEIAAFLALDKPEDETFALFIDIRKNRPQSAKMLNIDAQICTLLAKHPLLRDINANLAAAFSQSIRWVIKADYQKALDKFISLDNVEIEDNDAEAYIIFGQNLSAAAEDVDAYLYFKKIWISYLIDCSRKEEAGKDLDELGQLLPEDEDFAALIRRLDI
ncbi:MAG: glycosyltransferase family 2 protein [Clostridiales bacterium]